MKVTYLFGAGASVGVVPIVNTIVTNDQNKILGLADEMLSYASDLDNTAYQNNSNPVLMPFLKSAKDFASSLRKLAAKSNEYGSIDTYARKLFLQNEVSNLKELKNTLSIFLALIQEEKGFGSRYSSFLAKILEPTSTGCILPQNIKILTWNYDVQVELCMARFMSKEGQSTNIDNVMFRCKSAPMFTTGIADIVHLNGVAGVFEKNPDTFIAIYGMNDRQSPMPRLDFIHRRIIDLKEGQLRLGDFLTFAWEDPLNLVERAIQTVKSTRILVVIGYSFPFLNRDIDRRIIQSMVQSGLNKIYYQDPILDGSSLHEQLGISKNIIIEHLKEVNQFFVPHNM